MSITINLTDLNIPYLDGTITFNLREFHEENHKPDPPEEEIALAPKCQTNTIPELVDAGVHCAEPEHINADQYGLTANLAWDVIPTITIGNETYEDVPACEDCYQRIEDAIG